MCGGRPYDSNDPKNIDLEQKREKLRHTIVEARKWDERQGYTSVKQAIMELIELMQKRAYPTSPHKAVHDQMKKELERIDQELIRAGQRHIDYLLGSIEDTASYWIKRDKYEVKDRSKPVSERNPMVLAHPLAGHKTWLFYKIAIREAQGLK